MTSESPMVHGGGGASQSSDQFSEEDLDDLASFLQITPEECRRRLADHDDEAIDRAWAAAGAKSNEDVLDFFRSEDLLVWSHVKWHTGEHRRRYRDSLTMLLAHFPPATHPRVLDFGGGIGTDTVFLAEHGYDVTLVDLAGPMLSFAKHRIARRGLHANVVESSAALPEINTTYDVILCFDVFEHLSDPVEAARRMVAALRPGGVLLQFGNFSDAHEVHPAILNSGLETFVGERWPMHVGGLGMRRIADLVYVKERRVGRILHRLRFVVWRRTGVWVTRVPPRGTIA